MEFLKQAWSALFFSRANVLIREGQRKILYEQDLLEAPEWVNPRTNPLETDRIQWLEGRQIPWDFLRVCRPGLVLAYGCYAIATLVGLAQPILVNQFIGQISEGLQTPEALWFAIGCAIFLGLSAIVRGVSFQHFFFQTLKQYQMIVNAVNERLYRHSLRMSQRAKLQTPVGDVVNHMSSDSESLADFTMVFADLIFMSLTVLSVTGMLFYYIGWSALIPLLLLAVLAPATKSLAKKFTSLDEVVMKERDHRVTLMGQILNAIRVVKSFAWEKSVTQEIEAVRAKELSARRRMARAEASAGVAYVAVSSIVLFVALAIHVWRGFPLEPALVFTLVALFALLEEPFGNLSWTLSRTTNAFVSAGRIARFLSTESSPPNSSELAESSDETLGLQIGPLPEFGGALLQIPAGQSVALVGPVGSGKSTLLAHLLGESPDTRSTLICFDSQAKPARPKTSYVPQEAFIVNGSLRENLIFGAGDVTDEQIQRALSLADFEKDLALLPHGLGTEIGEKGVNLSGGQKQRVSLARAILRGPQIVILDDPLSAVDVETEEILCDRLIFGSWKHKTRLMATHRLEHLQQFDRILFLEEGRIVGDDSPANLLQGHGRFQAFVREHAKSQGQKEKALVSAPSVVAEAPSAASSERITEDEDREVGAVRGSVYWDYFKSLGGDDSRRFWRLSLLLVAAISVMALPLLQRWWLGAISTYQQTGELSAFGQRMMDLGLGPWFESPAASVLVYGVIGLGALALNLVNSLLWLERGIAAGQNMHEKMLSSLLKAPLRFFDSTPVGRILQRFSRDVESVDLWLQRMFSQAIHILIEIVLCLLLIVALVPAAFALIGPVLVLYYFMQRNYRRPAREVKRLDSIARSPRYAHFKETLVGLPVIRGFQGEKWFLEGFYARLAHSQRMFYNHVMLNRWFSVRIPIVGGMIATATTVAIVLSARAGHLNAGIAGVLTIYMLSFWEYLNWGVRIFAEIESRMTSVERMKHYSSLPSEMEISIPSSKPLSPDWPERGEIQFDQVEARYAPHLPRVLHGVSFTAEAGQKVGLIGRTGSGKSTVFQCLFRFVELEAGRILIDGVDIASVPLERLRRSIAIIPQDPTLFLGTIRSNLDRFGEYSDEAIEKALRQASMWNFVQAQNLGLHAPVLENGLNLSQGQRQLLCLARALLMGSKMIVLDEATASVDVETDALLQAVIREQLKGVTLLVIAHRLGTVGHCDKVVDLAFGRVLSESRPHEQNLGGPVEGC